MTLSKSSLSMDKRHSILRSFSWLPSPIINSAKEDHRQRTSVPFLNTHMNFTTPTLSLSPSSALSPTATAKNLGFFSKFRSSSTDLDQILSSSDEDDEEEDHPLPPTPRDSQRLPSSSITLTSSSSAVTLPAMPSSSSSSSSNLTSRTRARTTGPILTTTIITATDKPHAILASPSPLTNPSPPPHPPQHASLNQYIQNVLASTFDDVDKNIIEVEWDKSRRQLEIDLLTPAPFQYS